MEELTHLPAVIPSNMVKEMRQRAEDTLQGIYDDYFPEKTFEEFLANHLGHTSMVMKMAACRFADAEMFMKLRELLKPYAERVVGSTEFLIHPIFYLRFSFPGIYYSETHRTAFLDSQPHYDRSYGIDALTYWVALDDVDEETGGLCAFTSQEIVDRFPLGGKNPYSLKGYFEASEEIDPILVKSTVAPPIDAGDVLTFGSTTLHGATKPRGRRRVSLDFRLVPTANLEEASASIRNLFDEVNAAFDMCNANNLVVLGDFIGASRILGKLGAETGNSDLVRLGSAMAMREPDPAILQEGAETSWRREYNWLTQ